MCNRAGTTGKTPQLRAVTRRGDDQRAVALHPRHTRGPPVHRAAPQSGDDRRGGFGFAERGEHAAGQMAGGMPQRGCELHPQSRLGQSRRDAKPRDADAQNGDHSATIGM